ncbi:hypothetical protein O9K63_13410 [Janibacter cremeus]|uniref:hypothetical protein n=1 Tax=Janibacter cremeus TaxID=1285192 RepID=UPI0023F7B951|nr:hypothetical protein [Janibacter cremeus]WEV77580.1 hypothetical protein O9K63_13410 [Janibacter cremeus]
MTALAPWVYLGGVAVLLAFMAMRRNVIVPAVIATALTAWVYTGSVFKGLAAPFNGLIVATTELLNIFLVLAVIGAMTGALRAMDIDSRMLRPLVRFMRNGHMAFVVLFVASYLMSLVFWPTPTLAILAALLIPAAVAAGLTRLGAAIAIALSGQGMALASDYILGVAPGITASGAGLDAGVIADRALILSWIVGGVAAALVYFGTCRGRMVVARASRLGADRELVGVGSASEIHGDREVVSAVSAGMVRRETDPGEAVRDEGVLRLGDGTDPYETHPTSERQQRLMALVVPLVFLVMVVLLTLSRFTDLFAVLKEVSGAALIAGLGFGLLFIVCFLSAKDPLEAVASNVVDGLVFAYKAMGVVLPVAGFVLMGVGDFSAKIMTLPEGATAPAFLFDVIVAGQDHVPAFAPITCLALMVAGMLIGLDGSGWAGLPLIGALSEALGPAAGVDPETLAAIGQNAASWTGGGTLIAWSSLVAVAGVTGIPVVELVRRLFLPVVTGLVVATLVGGVVF